MEIKLYSAEEVKPENKDLCERDQNINENAVIEEKNIYGKYSKYEISEKLLDDIKRQINESKDKITRISAASFARDIGLLGKNDNILYWGLQYTLFYKGIRLIKTEPVKDGCRFFVMRERISSDILPGSYFGIGKKKENSSKKLVTFYFAPTNFAIEEGSKFTYCLVELVGNLAQNRTDFDDIIKNAKISKYFTNSRHKGNGRAEKIPGRNDFVKTNFSAIGIMEVCYEIIETFGYSRKDLTIRFNM